MPTGADDGLRRVDHDGVLALIDEAERAGVKKFVYTSYSGNVEFDCPLRTAKRDCETRLRRSEMDVVILRPTYFMEMWLGPHLGFDPLNATARVYGDGNGKVSYISALDVAEFAVAAALKPTAKETILEMGGPEALSQLDAVRIFEKVLGTTCRLEFVPVEALRQQHLSTDPLQKTFGALMLAYAEGDMIPGATTTADDYGIALRTVSEYAASVAAQGAGV
jgi:NADH dehydrogenase